MVQEGHKKAMLNWHEEFSKKCFIAEEKVIGVITNVEKLDLYIDRSNRKLKASLWDKLPKKV